MKIFNFSRIFFYVLCTLAIIAKGYPAHNYNILKNECIEKARQSFLATKMRDTKITVNERLMGYYGFKSSASAVILLDVSNTDVQLPKMNLSFTNLIMLHASNNGLEKIDDIGNETFSSLKFLNLSHNAISSVASHVFSHLSEVEVLDLSHNCFVQFNYDHVFLRHENLKKIYLQDNLLHTVHGTPGVNHVMSLDLLDLRRNSIEKFDTFNLQVKNLQLRSNELKSLTIHHAKAMTLDAGENSLSSFTSSGTFSHLDLSNNDFKLISQVEIREAKVLILSHNEIESNAEISSEEEDEDEEGIQTDILDISHNKLSSMHDLRHFKSCRVINLEGNELKNLDFEKIRQDFPFVKRVNLRRNPLTEIDLTEAKFHNDTRFLNIHFDYAVEEPAPFPSIHFIFPTLSTNIEESTTLSQTTTESYNQTAELLEQSEILLFIYFAIFALFMASILAIIYVIYSKLSTARKLHKFGEAENPL